MAPSRTRANTAVQTRPVVSETKLLLSPARTLEPCDKDFSSPPFASIRNHTVLARDLKPSNTPAFSSVEVPLSSGFDNLHAKSKDHESGSKNNEPNTMVESRARSCSGSIQVQAASEVKPREVTYAASAPGSPFFGKKPPRHDSAYYSMKGRDDASEVDFEVQVRQMRARERVQILRTRVLRTRRVRRERRGQLRHLRDNARDALDKLTRKINELVALGRLENLQAELSPYYDALRTAQDELGPAEDAFDNLEHRLDEEEQDLEDEEDHFYRHNNVLSLDVPDSKLDDELSPLVKPYHPPEAEVPELSLEDEKVRDYLAKIEEAERLKEELDDLESDYYQFSVDANFRKKHGIPLSTETAEFLKAYPDEYKECLSNLHTVEDSLLDLRDECIDQGLFSKSEYVYEPRDALYEEVMESVDEARERSPLRVAADHHREDETNFGDKRDYVNKWLLEWVSDSTVDTMMLQAWIYFEYPQNKNQDLGEERWTELVIDNWNKDGAGKMANQFYNASKLDAIEGDTGNLNAISTTRSGTRDIYGSLEVDAEEERSFEDVQSDNGSLTTQERNIELTPTKQSYQQTPSTEKTLKSMQATHPILSTPHPVTKASSVSCIELAPGHLRRTLHQSIEPSRRTKSAVPDQRTQEPQPKVTSSETDLSTLRYDASSTADLSTPLDGNHQSFDTFDQGDQELVNGHYHHSNASILSDLLIPLSDVL